MRIENKKRVSLAIIALLAVGFAVTTVITTAPEAQAWGARGYLTVGHACTTDQWGGQDCILWYDTDHVLY